METRKYSIEEAVEYLHDGGLIKYDVKNPALFNSIIRLAGSDYDYSFEKNKCYSFGGYGLVKYSEHSNGIPLSSISETPAHGQPKSASEAASVGSARDFILSKYPDADFEDKAGFINGGFWKGMESMIDEYAKLRESHPNQLLNEAVELIQKLKEGNMCSYFGDELIDDFLSKIKSV